MRIKICKKTISCLNVHYFKGVIYHDGSVIDSKEAFYNFININKQSADNIENLLAKCIGVFAFAIEISGNISIVVDIIRAFPLFVSVNDSEIDIYDNLNEYKDNKPLNNKAIEEFISSGYVYGTQTVFQDIYALQAGEILSINQNSWNSIRYFRFKPNNKVIVNTNDIHIYFDKILIAVFNRMLLISPKINRWVVPLSGGHDSRIIVNYLYRLGIKNVICYSYGKINNEQSVISKQVADTLGYEWHFIEYTEDKWQNLHETNLIEKFIDFGFNGGSTANLQDFLAVYELNKQGIVKKNDIFVPGHTLDFITGGHLNNLDKKCRNKKDAINRVIKQHTIRKKSSLIKKAIGELFDQSTVNPCEFQEYFNWQERQAKFIVNSIKVYEFFGYESRIPFWDKELVDFWLTVPSVYRIKRNIFYLCEKKGILIEKIKDIPYAGDRNKQTINNIKERLKQIIKRIIPTAWTSQLLRFSTKNIVTNEGLNLIFNKQTDSINHLIRPLNDFPESISPYFKNILMRPPYRIEIHFLCRLYTIRLQLNKKINNEN